MVARLEGWWVVVRWVFAGALVEGRWLVLVLPYTAFEVLSCRGVISAHLGKLGHEGALYGFEPLSGLGVNKGR